MVGVGEGVGNGQGRRLCQIWWPTRHTEKVETQGRLQVSGLATVLASLNWGEEH